MNEWKIPPEYLDQSEQIKSLQARVDELEIVIYKNCDPMEADEDDEPIITEIAMRIMGD